MRSFFSRIQAYFSQGYSGRYLGHILVEALREDSSLLSFLYPGLDKKIVRDKMNLEFVVEYSFPSLNNKRKQRYADLAVLYSGRVVGLMEIKCEDDFHEGQLEDYVNYLEHIRGSDNVCMTILSKYEIYNEYEQDLIRKGICENCLSYSSLYEFLIKKEHNSVVCKMLKEYLGENYIDIGEEYSDNALQLLVIKGLNLKHSHGFGKMVSNDNISSLPSVWEKQIRNISVLKNRFFEEHKECFNTKPSISFNFDPRYKLKSLTKHLKELNDSEEYDVSLPPKLKSGGTFSIWAQCRIKTLEKWLYINWGFTYRVQLQDSANDLDRSFSPYLFLEIYGQGGLYIDDEFDVPRPFDEKKCYNKICEKTEAIITELLPDAKEKDHAEALKALRGSLKRR